MIVKAVTLFLIFIGVLAMFGKFRPWRWLGLERTARICKRCKSPIPGKGSCPCTKT